MKKERWDQIEIILDTALTLSGSERTSYVNEACGDDEELLREIYELLEAVEDSEETHFLEGVSEDNEKLLQELSGGLFQSPEELIGSRIGAFRLSELLGYGGMGAVYRAERDDGQFRQQVAVKLLHQGIQSKETLQRFRVEQDILAALHHPGIAQLYDGGITKNGLPYLIMEYVDGLPIYRYCNEYRLTVEERLGLFKEVCAAMQFAHANLVIHRDLKAQNIYITANGKVKILDFGIAKLLDPKLTEQTLLQTRPGQKFWTPQYAAPEQVTGHPVTTATDVYALGVLLHKLLTDTYPLDLKDKDIPAVEQIIRDAPPVPASRSVADSSAGKKIARKRKCSVAELKKTLSGDLDSVMLKALRKEPEYRYNSVGQLTEDLERYENGVPLVARKDTVRYRIGKFFRRHKAGITISFIVLLIIAGVIAFYTCRITQEKNIALNEANKSNQIAIFLTNLFEASDPEVAKGQSLNAVDLLDQGIEKIHQLDQYPLVKAEMLSLIGKVYLKLGSIDKVNAPLDTALAIQKNILGVKDSSYISTLQTKGLYLREIGERDSAILIFNEAASYSQEALGKTNQKTLDIYTDLGFTLRMSGKLDSAEIVIKEMLAIRQELFRKHNSKSIKEEISQSWYVYASLLRGRNKLDEAEQAQLNSLKIMQQLYKNESHPGILANLNGLALIKKEKKQYNEAIAYFEKTYKMCIQIYGETHPQTARAFLNIGELYMRMENWTEAKNYLDRAASIWEALFPSGHPEITRVRNNIEEVNNRIN